MLRRRWTDKIRELADELWERGNKDLATEVHATARQAEAERRTEHVCTCGVKTMQAMFHKNGCPFRERVLG